MLVQASLRHSLVTIIQQLTRKRVTNVNTCPALRPQRCLYMRQITCVIVAVPSDVDYDTIQYIYTHLKADGRASLIKRTAPKTKNKEISY